MCSSDLEGAGPTMLCAGLGPVGEPTPADDVAAIIAVVAAIVGCEPSFAALAHALIAEVGAVPPAYTPPSDGESLYAAADALDIAVLAALGSR